MGNTHKREKPSFFSCCTMTASSAAATPLVLAFHALRSGETAECSLVGLGAAVLHQGRVLAQQRWGAYTDDVHFAPGYFQSFYAPRNYVLQALAVEGTKDDAVKALLRGFQHFRTQWETEAVERGVPLHLVASEGGVSLGAVNAALQTYTNDRPLPYGANSTKYYRCWDADSLCRGWLTHVDPSYTQPWGLDLRLEQLLQNVQVKVPALTGWPDDEAVRTGWLASLALGCVSLVGV